MNEVSKNATAFSWIRISECTSRKDASAGSAQVCIMMGKRNKVRTHFIQVMLDTLFYFIR